MIFGLSFGRSVSAKSVIGVIKRRARMAVFIFGIVGWQEVKFCFELEVQFSNAQDDRVYRYSNRLHRITVEILIWMNLKKLSRAIDSALSSELNQFEMHCEIAISDTFVLGDRRRF